MANLKERLQNYKDLNDVKLMARLPIIVVINGRSFNKLTSLLDKPFCHDFSESMISTMDYLCKQIDGVVFGYYHNDEICLIIRNDQTPDTQPWCDNKLQKINSLTSSMATLKFNQAASANQLNLLNDAIFYSTVFTVPNISEAINTLIFKQQANFYISVQHACLYELLNKYNQNSIKEMLKDLTLDEKKDLLSDECDINFHDYSSVFKKGAACYKVPKIIDGNLKSKWQINKEIPTFSKDQNFLNNIIKTGTDIIRKDVF